MGLPDYLDQLRAQGVRHEPRTQMHTVPQERDQTFSWVNLVGGWKQSNISTMFPGDPSSFDVLAGLEPHPDGTLRFCRGIDSVASPSGTLEAVFAQSRPDGLTEFVMIAPPYIHLYRVGIGVSTYNVALPTAAGRWWVATNFNDYLIFTDGITSVWSHLGGAATIAVTTLPVGKTLATFNSRVFVGNYDTGGGIFDPLGLYWSGVGGFNDQTVPGGAGSEPLLGGLEGGIIKAVRSMGLDRLVILLTNGGWVGVRTDDLQRPADLAPVWIGRGCLFGETAQATADGIMYTGPSGVMLYDGSGPHVVSLPITAEIDNAYVVRRRAFYDNKNHRYMLSDSTRTFTYDDRLKAWHEKPFGFLSAASDSFYVVAISLDGTKYGLMPNPSADENTAFGAAFVPQIDASPHPSGADMLWNYKYFIIEAQFSDLTSSPWVGTLTLPDALGNLYQAVNFSAVRSTIESPAAWYNRKKIPLNHVGRGINFRLGFTLQAKNPKIRAMHLIASPASERLYP